jgi:hypothetical protein
MGGTAMLELATCIFGSWFLDLEMDVCRWDPGVSTKIALRVEDLDILRNHVSLTLR